jgi:hypothetical protein
VPVYNATNPVAIGNATKKDDYDRAFDNIAVVRAGGVAIASQAALDFVHATSTTQLGRVAGVASKFPRLNAAGTAWEMADTGAIHQVTRGLRLGTTLDGTTNEANKVSLRALDELVMLDGAAYTGLTFPLDADITASGAGGLDTGARTASRWYEIYAIGKSSTLAAADLRLLLHLAKRYSIDTSFTTAIDVNRVLRLATGTATDKIAQGFQLATSGIVTHVDINGLRAGSPTGHVWFTIEADVAGNPSGVALATSDKVPIGEMSTGQQEWRFLFPSRPSLTSATQYHLVLQGDYTRSDTDGIRWAGVVAGGYANGSSREYNGAAWSATAGASGLDRYFKVYLEIPSAALTFPAGYDQSCLLGYVYNDSGNALVPFNQVERHVVGYGLKTGYKFGTNVGYAIATLVDLSTIVPPVPIEVESVTTVAGGAGGGTFSFVTVPFVGAYTTHRQFQHTFTLGEHQPVGVKGFVEHQGIYMYGGDSGGGLTYDGYITGWRF